MITSPLMSNVCQRAMITPVSPLLTSLIHISLGCWTIYRLFEILLEMELFTGLDFKSNVLYKSIASKEIQSDMNYVLKIITQGSTGSNERARVKHERTKSRERLLRTILFYSGHLQHERSDMEQNIYPQ